MRFIDEDQAHARDGIIQSLKDFPFDFMKIYSRSFYPKNGLWYGLARTPEGKRLAIIGEKHRVLKDPFQGNCHHRLLSLKLCDLSAENTVGLMELFPYTRPVSLQNYLTTIGIGDHLGVAAPGHIRAIKKFHVHPVLAQRSVIENTQTGRDFTKGARDAAWAVFQENYQEGYGAGGDHLKSLQEVRCAVNAGASMVTLDLSEKIDSEALQGPKELIDRKFDKEIDEGDAKVIFHLFLHKEFAFSGAGGKLSIQFDEESVKRNTLLFHKALDFTEEVYEWIRLQKENRGSIDFEISLDEAPFPTSPENHFFFALELTHRGVHIRSLAPRFVAQFQKDIDTRGDREAFRRQFFQHALIAEDYGNHKVSIHSGIDKCSLFSDIGELSKGFFHLKISGTSWLETIRLIAIANPTLYRKMHSFARSGFEGASKRHSVTADLSRMPSIERLGDGELPSLQEREDFRQLFHITEGYLLNAEDEAKNNLFKKQIYCTLLQHEEDYWSMLETRIEKHLSSFGVKKKQN